MGDGTSVYVGGLSYDSTEDVVRKAFTEYGEIVSVKIVYDRDSGESRGFGFVTFTNPRAAANAIQEMDGNLIAGRTVRVNEVKKHRLLNRDGFFRDRDRDRDRDRVRTRRPSPPPSRSARARSPLPHRSRSPRPGGSPSRYPSPGGRPRTRSPRSSPSPQSSDGAHREEEGSREAPKVSSRVGAKEKQADIKLVKDELERAIEGRKQLEEKVANLKGVVERAEQTIASLQCKSQKLEDSLANAMSVASNRQLQLRRLQSGVSHYKSCSEKLTNSERDMKALLSASVIETDNQLEHRIDGDADVAFTNGGPHEGASGEVLVSS